MLVLICFSAEFIEIVSHYKKIGYTNESEKGKMIFGLLKLLTLSQNI